MALSSPLDVTATRTGDIFIADNGNSRVAWVTLDPFATSSSTHSDFSQPAGITLGPDGLLYVSDRDSKKIIKLRIDRNQYGAIDTLTHISTWLPTGSSALSTPRGICVDYAGFVYVADLGASKVVVFDASGAFVRSLSPGYAPYDVDVSPDGQYLYVAAALRPQAVQYKILVDPPRPSLLSLLLGAKPGRNNELGRGHWSSPRPPFRPPAAVQSLLACQPREDGRRPGGARLAHPSLPNTHPSTSRPLSAAVRA